jgi:hypothetical protein
VDGRGRWALLRRVPDCHELGHALDAPAFADLELIAGKADDGCARLVRHVHVDDDTRGRGSERPLLTGCFPRRTDRKTDGRNNAESDGQLVHHLLTIQSDDEVAGGEPQNRLAFSVAD